MSGLDGLQLDADGFVDMDQFPDDGTDLPEADLAELRDTLHSDPVDEPTDAEWDAMFDQVLASDDTGPFTVDDVDVAADGADTDAGDDLFGAEAGEALADEDASSDDADPSSDDADTSSDDVDTVDVDAASADVDDLGLDGSTDVDVADLDLDGSTDLDVTADDLDYDGGLDLTVPDDGLDDAFAADAVDDVPADIANNDFEDLL